MTSFADLIRRVRARDQQAAEELFQQYGEEIARVVRVRYERKLRARFDTADICQSVFGAFFLRVALGQYDLETPENLLKLLITMAKNKRRNLLKRQHEQHFSETSPEPPDQAASPSSIVADQELFKRVWDQLTAEERYLVEQRVNGRKYKELAAELGEQPDAIRQRHDRAIERAVKSLGLPDLFDLA